MDPLADDLLVPQKMSGMISLEGTRVLLSLVMGTTGWAGGRGSPSRGGCNNIQLESDSWSIQGYKAYRHSAKLSSILTMCCRLCTMKRMGLPDL